MAKVNICNVEVLNNESTFFDPFKFRVTFECHEPLEEDLEWKLVYVSSAYNESLDQTLDSILVGPVPVGRHQFVFEADAPDPQKIPPEDIVGVTVVLIQALYRDKEFIRVGYYVNNDYKTEELRSEPPAEPILEKLERNIIASDPRVTRFPIDWGDGLLDGCPEPDQTEGEGEESLVENLGAGPAGIAASFADAFGASNPFVTNTTDGVQNHMTTQESNALEGRLNGNENIPCATAKDDKATVNVEVTGKPVQQPSSNITPVDEKVSTLPLQQVQ